MKTFTLKPGRYLLADACYAKNEYYDEFILPAFEDFGRGECDLIGSTFLMCTAADGLYAVTDTSDDSVLTTLPVDAANFALIPERVVDTNRYNGMWIESLESITVQAYYDAVVIDNTYRVRY